MRDRLRRFATLFLVVSFVTGLPGLSLMTLAQEPHPRGPTVEELTLATPSLHNPNFDNHDWYEFNNRYGHYVSGSWLPDDDNNVGDDIPLSSRQDWRLWFLDGRDILEFDPNSTYALHDEAVQVRIYDQDSIRSHLGGLYQVIYGVTPCLTYEFKMHAHSRPAGDGAHLYALQVGMDREGWRLPIDDPAVHDAFPASIVWGEPKIYTWNYGELSVQAEAWANDITVFTYADAVGTRSHEVYWDSGSFAEVTEELYDPTSHSATGGIYNLDYNSVNDTLTWSTNQPAVSQVFYRAQPQVTPPTTDTYTYTVYLPLVFGPQQSWSSSPIDKTYNTSHAVTLSNLQPGYTYEYFVVSRGLSGDQCTSWVSSIDTFQKP
jgi:hypothetical protein